VVESAFMHDRYGGQAAAGAHQTSLVVATPHKVFSLCGAD
jgi:hypothetical protein